MSTKKLWLAMLRLLTQIAKKNVENGDWKPLLLVCYCWWRCCEQTISVSSNISIPMRAKPLLRFILPLNRPIDRSIATRDLAFLPTRHARSGVQCRWFDRQAPSTTLHAPPSAKPTHRTICSKRRWWETRNKNRSLTV